MIDPSDYRLVASMVANGHSMAEVAYELGEDLAEVRRAVERGSLQRNLNE